MHGGAHQDNSPMSKLNGILLGCAVFPNWMLSLVPVEKGRIMTLVGVVNSPLSITINNNYYSCEMQKLIARLKIRGMRWSARLCK